TLVPETVAEALGVRGSAGAALDAELANHLRQRHTCLVLDNFEQVLAARDLVASLLPAAPRVKVIVTSREPLSIYGEHVFVVPPLGLSRTADKRRSPAE